MTDLQKIEVGAQAATQADLKAATQAVDTALTDAGRYANQATAGIQVARRDAQGFLRRNVWALLGVAVLAVVVAVLVTHFG